MDQKKANITSLSSATLTYKCPDCGRRVAPIAIDVFGRERLIKAVCECEQERWKQEAKEAEAEEKRRSIAKLFSMAELGPRFEECTFEAWSPRLGAARAYKAALDYADKYKTYLAEGRGLIFFGPPGNGKSHLAAAIINKLIGKGVACVCRTVPSLLKTIKATWDEDIGVTEHGLIQALVSADLVVLDDAGAEKWSEWSESTLYYVIDERYRWQKSIIMTSNCSLDALEIQIGERAFDRLIETCALIENRAASYRQELARERLKKVGDS